MPRGTIGKKSAGDMFVGPVAGAYTPITVYFERAGTTVTDTVVCNLDDVLPPGMTVRLLGLSVAAGALSAGSGTVQVGTSGDADAYVTAQAIAAGSSYTKCDGVSVANATVGDYEFDPTDAAAAGTLRVTVTLSGATFDTLTVILWVQPTAHDTDKVGR